jgi:hypothetical protein
MKRHLTFMSLLCMLVFIAVPNVSAQKSTETQDMKFYITLGAAADDGFNWFYWTGGALMDIYFGDNLVLSPEAMFRGYKFDFDYSLLFYPGATLNLLLGKSENKLFVGGGVFLFIPINPPGMDTGLELKINGGMISNNMRLTVYIMTPFSDIFGTNILGANIGFAL